MSEPADLRAGDIFFEEVSKSFKKTKALDGITLIVNKGDLFGFLGPNGAGKTTAMRILLGLLEADSGTVLIDAIRFKDDPDLRRRTGVILDGHGLYESMTLYDNLLYYASLYKLQNGKEAVSNIIRRVGLTAREKDRVAAFSTGMKKKAALARALIHEPEYLFLDEPTTGLDPEAQIEFRELIRNLSEERGITLFLNSHNLDEVQKICNKVAIVSKGSILVSDTVEALRKRYSEPTVHITLYSDGDALKISGLLQKNEKIKGTTVSGNQVAAVLRDKDFSLRELLGYTIEIKEFSSKVKTLEEVYMDII